MSAEQPEYYRSRAAEERDAAARAPNPAVARTHNDLAAMYDRMASQATERKREHRQHGVLPSAALELAQQAEAYVEELA